MQNRRENMAIYIAKKKLVEAFLKILYSSIKFLSPGQSSGES